MWIFFVADAAAGSTIRLPAVTAAEVERQLQCAVDDGLIIAYTAVGNKGSKVGTEQEGYKLPDARDNDDDSNAGDEEMVRTARDSLV